MFGDEQTEIQVNVSGVGINIVVVDVEFNNVASPDI